MDENLRSKNGSKIYAQIEAANLAESEREAALNALATAEVMVDAAMWVARKFEEMSAHLFLKPGVKH